MFLDIFLRVVFQKRNVVKGRLKKNLVETEDLVSLEFIFKPCERPWY